MCLGFRASGRRAGRQTLRIQDPLQEKVPGSSNQLLLLQHGTDRTEQHLTSSKLKPQRNLVAGQGSSTSVRSITAF